jgi:N-acetylglucosaminyl-diphospho-decaprenol L-rhamnosyltransferase
MTMATVAAGPSQLVRPIVDVIVVNWNTGCYLRSCLDSLARARGDHELRVVVVDNASTDGSAGNLRLGGSPVRLLRNEQNTGFAAACNQGARVSAADFLLLLNPDATVAPDAIGRAVAFLRSPSGAGVGICGGAVADELGAPAFACARFPSLRTTLGGMTGLSRVAPRMFPPHYLPQHELARDREVDQVIGAFYLVRREVWEALGGFDERYFIYYEEVDFARRARLLGWRSWYLHDVHVQHVGGISSNQVLAFRLYHSLRSRTLYAKRHWNPPATALLILLSLTLEPVARLARAAVTRRWRELAEVSAAFIRYTASVPSVVSVPRLSLTPRLAAAPGMRGSDGG